MTVTSGQPKPDMGDTFDRAKMPTLVQGGYVVAEKKGMNHYVTSSTGRIRITAHGPFQITYANPKGDPCS